MDVAVDVSQGVIDRRRDTGCFVLRNEQGRATGHPVSTLSLIYPPSSRSLARSSLSEGFIQTPERNIARAEGRDRGIQKRRVGRSKRETTGIRLKHSHAIRCARPEIAAGG